MSSPGFDGVPLLLHILPANPEAVKLQTGSVTLIVTSFDEAVQAPFEMVHLNTLDPFERPVTVVPGLEGAVMVPLPLIFVQVPVPTVGVFPFNVAVETVIF